MMIDQVVIENKQHYKVLGKPVDLTTLIRLQVENGKVVKHEDWYVTYLVVSYSFVSCIHAAGLILYVCIRSVRNESAN